MGLKTMTKKFRFNLLDYVIFGITIVISIAIGIYCGYFKKIKISAQRRLSRIDLFASHTTNAYLFGTRNFHPVQIGLSLFSGYLSAIELIGTPAEIYYYGTQYWLILISICIMGVIVAFVYIPVYHAIGVTTSYQYLGLRFHPNLGTFASIIFVINEIIYLPIVVYGPAISFNQVSGANVYVISFILCLSCAIYTIVGGAQAVITTDYFHGALMLSSVTFIVIYGLNHADGLKEVISKNKRSAKDRFELFDFSPSLYDQNTFWSVLIGGLFYWTAFNAVDQKVVQRYMSVSVTWEAQYSVAVFVCFTIPFISLCCFTGLQMFAFFEYCDPLTAGVIQHEDQIVTLYIIQAFGHLKTASGIHLAGVVGASLSSLSTSINSTAAVVYENILKRFFELAISKVNSVLLIRILVVVLAVIAFALVFFVHKLGGGVSSTLTVISSCSVSTIFGIFTLGMLIPWSNTRGALIGCFAGFFLTAWIAIGIQISSSKHLLPSYKLPDEVIECPVNFTITTTPQPDGKKILSLYKISDYWISTIGVITVVTVGTIASFLSSPTNLKTLDRKLISPVLLDGFRFRQ